MCSGKPIQSKGREATKARYAKVNEVFRKCLTLAIASSPLRLGYSAWNWLTTLTESTQLRMNESDMKMLFKKLSQNDSFL